MEREKTGERGTDRCHLRENPKKDREKDTSGQKVTDDMRERSEG